jgi:dienelactone hydrolase
MSNRIVCCWVFLTIAVASTSRADERLPGTQPLDTPKEIVQVQLKQVTDYFKRRISAAREIRDKKWQIDFTSMTNYQASVEPHRTNLRRMLGLIDNKENTSARLINIANESDCRIDRVSIPLADGLAARGLLFTPQRNGAKPAVVVIPDADTWPEQFAGLLEDRAVPIWLSALLGRGVVVYIPQSIERLQDHPYCQQTRNKDRRWILYRLGFCIGHTMPGLDVQETLSAVEFLTRNKGVDPKRIGMIGIGQGAMTASFAAALDRRIAAVALIDYFENRDQCWDEPFDRRIRDRLLEFGDAELAALIAPRRLTIATSEGFLRLAHHVDSEFQRVKRIYAGLKRQDQLASIRSNSPSDAFERVVKSVADRLAAQPESNGKFVFTNRVSASDASKQRNTHFEERMRYLRKLIDASEEKRYDHWGILKRPTSQFAAVKARLLDDYRSLVGNVPRDGSPLNPRTQLALITKHYKAYRITLDVVEGVQVYGNLLVPLENAGRRPAVICQHGLNGTPEMVTGLGMTKDTVYHEFGRKLAERGYVVFAPLLLHHNPVQQITDQTRQAGTVGMMRIAISVAKTKRIIDFLETQPYVDSGRIGYYGLSYGGYSAIWMSPLCERLAVTVVSGYFNDWRTKLVSDQRSTSYLLHPSEDMYNWNILHRFTHPELIAMISPRPCCIEFGTRDGITTPEWTAYAWKQTKEIRDHLNLGDRIILAEFDGTHEVRGEEAFDFVDKFLRKGRD